ncbi:MAG: ribonuclease HII [Pyrinomonadaceae bacterium]
MKDAEKVDTFDKDASVLRVSLFSDLRITEIGFEFEKQVYAEGFRFIAGVDEVGRGCLAGPVVAAACILDLDKPFPKGLDDSKKLTTETREEIAAQLKDVCIAYAIAQVEADEVDRINILEATKVAMLNAIDKLKPAADFLLIDALKLKRSTLPQMAIIKGDCVSASIAAASILAKTFRDDLMKAYDIDYPQYGFASHKGYGAPIHWEALRQHGPCPLHRLSFRGVCNNDDEKVLFAGMSVD